MKEVTVEELEKFDFYLIGDSDRESYYPAIIGLSKDYSHVLYSYDKLVSCFAKANNWSEEEAVDWVDYNVIRALVYYGSKAPKITYTNYVTSKNKKYFPVKVLTTN